MLWKKKLLKLLMMKWHNIIIRLILWKVMVHFVLVFNRFYSGAGMIFHKCLGKPLFLQATCARTATKQSFQFFTYRKNKNTRGRSRQKVFRIIEKISCNTLLETIFWNQKLLLKFAKNIIVFSCLVCVMIIIRLSN